MKDAELKQIKNTIKQDMPNDLKKLLAKKPIDGITSCECINFLSGMDNSYMELYLGIKFGGDHKAYTIIITIDNYMLIPNMCEQLDSDAKIPEKYYYPPAVGEVRQEVSNLSRAKLRVFWVILSALKHYSDISLIEDSEWEKFISSTYRVVEVNTVGRIKYSYSS